MPYAQFCFFHSWTADVALKWGTTVRYRFFVGINAATGAGDPFVIIRRFESSLQPRELTMSQYTSVPIASAATMSPVNSTVSPRRFYAGDTGGKSRRSSALILTREESPDRYTDNL